MLGFDSTDELLNRDWTDFIHPDELPDAVQNVERALAAPEWTAFPAVRRRVVGRSEVPVELSTLRIELDNGPALALVVRDLREREQLEGHLLEAERMAAVGTLAAGVAHEVNNPLAYVIANLAFLGEHIPRLEPDTLAALRPELEEVLSEAQQGVDRVRQIVRDLKTFTRGEDQEQRVELKTIVASTIKMAQPGIRHRARITTRYAPAPEVKANVSRLAQVILNLLVNASQAARDGDPLAIGVSVDTTADGYARLRVADNGRGIAADVLPHVFEPFYTTKPVGVGTGLGLSVCRNIIDKYGGRISIDSTRGQGTIVSVLLPPAPAGFSPHRSSATMKAVRMERYRILIVDDDPLVVKAMRRLLHRHDVTTAPGGAEALAILEQRSDFDVILCDLMMPGVTGMDVLRTTRVARGGPRAAHRVPQRWRRHRTRPVPARLGAEPALRETPRPPAHRARPAVFGREHARPVAMSGTERILVVGGGYAGTAFAVHLCRSAPEPLDIVVVEPREQVGGGLAHSAVDPDHRLNASDTIHFLYPEDVTHLRRWLESSGRLAADPDAWSGDGRLYPRRGDFGRYLSAEFAAHAASNPSGSTLSHRRGAATGIEKQNRGFRIEVTEGDPIDADRCVIAIGQEPAPAKLPGLAAADAGDGSIDDPFSPGALAAIDTAANVLILGTGLTSADVVASLVGHGHRGPITCISRRGVRPQQQNPTPAAVPLWDRLLAESPAFIEQHGRPTSLLPLMRIVREQARSRLARQEPWHEAIDEVRDAAGELWRALPVSAKQRFLRHVRPYYDSHRFRLPPQTKDILASAEARGQLAFETGRVVHAEPRLTGLDVVVRARGRSATRTRSYAAVVNCAGFASRVNDWQNPFVRACLRQGLARPSDMGRGFEADAACRVIAANGKAHSDLRVIGALTLDRFGETPAAIFILRQILRMLPGFVGSARAAPLSGELPSASSALSSVCFSSSIRLPSSSAPGRDPHSAPGGVCRQSGRAIAGPPEPPRQVAGAARHFEAPAVHAVEVTPGAQGDHVVVVVAAAL